MKRAIVNTHGSLSEVPDTLVMTRHGKIGAVKLAASFGFTAAKRAELNIGSESSLTLGARCFHSVTSQDHYSATCRKVN